MVVEAIAPRRRTSPRIDQAVHGYERGHRLLASSRNFDDAADQLLGSMSDLLTTRLLEGGSSYLVGYPLKAQNSYVLARTWAANEMPRPGSVWTHSLIVDYQTLATLEDPSCLLGLLRRPDSKIINSFADPIVKIPAGPKAPSHLTPAIAETAIENLYSTHPARSVVLTSTVASDDEQLLLALWRQMWPALRRDTAFFSFADETPPAVDASCIIQFAGKSQKCASTSGSRAEAARLLVDDLPKVTQTPLRGFLARHAFDAPEPRAAVIPLVNLWQAMMQTGQSTIISALADTLPYANVARLARSVLGQLIEDASGRAPLLEIVERFGDLKVEMRDGWLMPPTSWAAPDNLGKLLNRSASYAQGTLAFAIFDTLASTTPIEDLARGDYSDTTAARLLEVRPELLDQRYFWEKRKTTRAALIRKAAAFGRPLQTIVELARNSLTSESVAALLDGWPDQLGDLIDDLAKTPGGSRLTGAALGRRVDLLQLALGNGVRFPPDLADEAIAQGFKDYSFAYPPTETWCRLASTDGNVLLPNLMVLSFADALGRGGGGRKEVVRLFAPLKRIAVSNALSPDARRYLEKALRTHRIYGWSISDALQEALIATFHEGRSVSVDILDAVGRGEINGLVEALYFKLGLDAVRDLKWRAQHAGERFDGWKIRCLEDLIRRKEKKWLW